jgi:hypothetical protein
MGKNLGNGQKTVTIKNRTRDGVKSAIAPRRGILKVGPSSQPIKIDNLNKN